jgi:AbiV family abortive infection protein
MWIMEQKTNFLGMYTAAHNNAVQLLREAEIMFERKSYPRAYFLAFTGLEEIAKSQLAADVSTGFIEEKVFWEYFKSHNKKIGRMVWASLDAEAYLDVEQETYLEIEHPTTAERMNTLYAYFDKGKVIVPTDVFTEDKARAIIHTLRVAIDRIIEMTEHWGHQIGTKGFMK